MKVIFIIKNIELFAMICLFILNIAVRWIILCLIPLLLTAITDISKHENFVLPSVSPCGPQLSNLSSFFLKLA